MLSSPTFQPFCFVFGVSLSATLRETRFVSTRNGEGRQDVDDSELNLDGLDSNFPRQVALRICQAIADNEPFLGKEGSGVEWNGAVRNANIMPPPPPRVPAPDGGLGHSCRGINNRRSLPLSARGRVKAASTTNGTLGVTKLTRLGRIVIQRGPLAIMKDKLQSMAVSLSLSPSRRAASAGRPWLASSIRLCLSRVSSLHGQWRSK